jgi:putative ABC transport system permease protein
MLPHLRYSIRVLRSNPSFSFTVILTLALGIGLTTAVFSVVDGVLLRPLPYSNPSALITGPFISSDTSIDWRRRTESLDDIGLYDFSVPQLLLAGDETARIRQAAVSSNLLSILGVRPVVGRDFQPADSEVGAEPVVMLTYGAWQQYFGGRSDVVGAIAPFDPIGRRVIGVLPASFVFPMRVIASAGAVKMLTPISTRPPQNSEFAVIARLNRGASLAEARAEYLASFPQAATEDHVSAAPNLTALSEAMLGASRPPLLMLLGAVGFLLLIACANVGNLLFAKGAEARKDLAVRFALGARRRDLAGLIIMQSCALSTTGGVLGVFLAYVSFDALLSLVPTQLPRAGAITVDMRVLGFSFLLSVISGATVGVFPAWYLARGEFQSTLQTQDRATLPAQRLRLILLTSEIALSVVLLWGGLLFARSFVRLLGVDLGFVPRDVLTLKVRTVESRFSTLDQQRAFLDHVLSQIAALPGVTGVGAVELLPVTRARRSGSVVAVKGRTAESIETEPRVISAGYFETMHIGVVLGRPFNRSDVSGSTQVAIVSEGLARRLWSGSNPIGHHIRYEKEEQREVVGVVRDVRSYAVDTTPGPEIYIPYSQTWLIPQQLVVRTDGNPTPLIAALRRQIRIVDARASAEDVRPLTEHVASSIAQPRFQAWLLGILGGCGSVLTILGIAGVVAYAVSRRRREIGIRIALGASRLDVIRTVVAPSLSAVALGLSIGLGVALALGRFARAFLFEIEPHDPVTLSAVVAILGGTALASAWLPARRATQIDPILVLRAE